MTNITPENPWRNLKSPYVLPEDLVVLKDNKKDSSLHFDIMPGQFIGGLDGAEVVFLALNPGFDENDHEDLQIPGFADDIMHNHVEPRNSLFYILKEEYSQTCGYKWWATILNPLVTAGVSIAALRTRIMTIEYFPYHSVSYKDFPTIPSQPFAFCFVKEAMKQGKIIVIMRSKDLWFDAVPGLRVYKHLIVDIKNVRRPYVSANNIGQENFDAILARLIS